MNVRPRVRHAFHVQRLSEAIQPISGALDLKSDAGKEIIMPILIVIRMLPQYVTTKSKET